jgi:hypothetical protein
MKKNALRKLSLNKDTIRQLTDNGLGAVHGGKINLSQFVICSGPSLQNSACDVCNTEVGCISGDCLTFETHC